MSNISVKKFYKTKITRYGTVQSFNRTAAYLPNPEESEMSSSDEEKTLILNMSPLSQNI